MSNAATILSPLVPRSGILVKARSGLSDRFESLSTSLFFYTCLRDGKRVCSGKQISASSRNQRALAGASPVEMNRWRT